MSKLRVLQICEAANAGVGGHTVDLTTGLLEAGCDVHLLYSTKRIDDAFRQGLKRLPELHSQTLDMRRSPHPADMMVVSAVRKYIKKNGPFDVIHGQSSKGGAIARLAGATGKTPVIYTPNCISTMAPTFGRVSKSVYRWIEWGLGFSTSLVICTSPDEFEHIRALGIPEKKLRMIYYGIKPPPATSQAAVRASLGLAESDLVVGFIGRLSAQKNPEMLLRSFADAARDVPQAKLALVGTGELESHLRELARSLNVAERVHWLGYRVGNEVMPAFDILAVPSRYDTGPIVMMEAMCMDVPILITNVGCVRYVMKDGENGYVVEPDDLPGFTNKLRTLFTSNSLRTQLATAAREEAKQFRRETMLAKTLLAYEDAIASRRK